MEFTAGFHNEWVYMLVEKLFPNNHTLTQVLNIDLSVLSDLAEQLIALREDLNFEEEGFNF